jgi:hypothetical protein
VKRLRYSGLGLLALLTACAGAAGTRRAHPLIGAGTLVDRTILVAGTAGTVTVGTGKYLTLCSAAGTATNATITVTPCGPSVASCTAQPAVTVPNGIPVSIPFVASPDAVADTSTIVFANTNQYFCVGQQYSP